MLNLKVACNLGCLSLQSISDCFVLLISKWPNKLMLQLNIKWLSECLPAFSETWFQQLYFCGSGPQMS